MSLLWRTAVEHTQPPVEMMSLKDIDDLHSGDYCVPMKHIRGEMRREWEDQQEGYSDSPHARWIEHGGPDAYINHLTDQIREHGGIREPLEIMHAPEGNGHDGGYDEDAYSYSDQHWVNEGHHRYLAARQAGLREVPVRHYYGHADDRGRIHYTGSPSEVTHG